MGLLHSPLSRLVQLIRKEWLSPECLQDLRLFDGVFDDNGLFLLWCIELDDFLELIPNAGQFLYTFL